MPTFKLSLSDFPPLKAKTSYWKKFAAASPRGNEMKMLAAGKTDLKTQKLSRNVAPTSAAAAEEDVSCSRSLRTDAAFKRCSEALTKVGMETTSWEICGKNESARTDHWVVLCSVISLLAKVCSA